MRSLSALGAVAVAAVLIFAGCGETVIDSTKLEEQLKASLANSQGEKISSVACPSDVEVEKGTTFVCSIKVKKGAEEVATIEIRNENADTSVINLRPANE